MNSAGAAWLLIVDPMAFGPEETVLTNLLVDTTGALVGDGGDGSLGDDDPASSGMYINSESFQGVVPK